MLRSLRLHVRVIVIATAGALAGCPSEPADPAERSITAVTVTPGDETIPATTGLSYTAVASYSDGSTEDKTSVASWSSSDASVAAIDGATGVATGLKDGETTIEATVECGGKQTATCRGVFVAVGEGHPAYHRW